MVAQQPDAVQEVRCIEGSVFESEKTFEVLFLVVNNECIGRLVHAPYEFIAFVDDGGAVTPGKKRCKKSGDFYVLLLAKTVWNGDGIFFNKALPVVQRKLFVQDFFQDDHPIITALAHEQGLFFFLGWMGFGYMVSCREREMEIES
jgi:hypothetical protein